MTQSLSYPGLLAQSFLLVHLFLGQGIVNPNKVWVFLSMINMVPAKGSKDCSHIVEHRPEDLLWNEKQQLLLCFLPFINCSFNRLSNNSLKSWPENEKLLENSNCFTIYKLYCSKDTVCRFTFVIFDNQIPHHFEDAEKHLGV